MCSVVPITAPHFVNFLVYYCFWLRRLSGHLFLCWNVVLTKINSSIGISVPKTLLCFSVTEVSIKANNQFQLKIKSYLSKREYLKAASLMLRPELQPVLQVTAMGLGKACSADACNVIRAARLYSARRIKWLSEAVTQPDGNHSLFQAQLFFY